MNASLLHGMLDDSALRRPEHPAVEEISGEVINYAVLAELSDRLRDRLVHMGVTPGDRVGICIRKSIDTVIAIFGVLKAGAAYVPVDDTAPAGRSGYIFSDCKIKAIIVEEQFVEALSGAMAELGSTPVRLVLSNPGGGEALRKSLDQFQQSDPAPVTESVMLNPEELAYILYTSGSTGKPKGVMISHRAAKVFIDWCSETFEPRENDRYSSHAPFHFDLSIHDIYVPIKHAATLVLIDHTLGRDPARLAPMIEVKKLTVWYSAPSILNLLVQYGNLDERDYSTLRAILFAGEVFPVQRLHALMKQVPDAAYYNLYGPTETNVCTYFEIPAEIQEDRTEPYPIGRTCTTYTGRVVDGQGNVLPTGEEGELCVSGPGVMNGYWNLDGQTSAAFFEDENGQLWYRTGDIVADVGDGIYIYRGRRDRMIKRRGYRVELGEIEACLYQNPDLRQAAVIAEEGDDGMVIIAFLSTVDGSTPSMIKLKRFCSERLPLYMIPDRFTVLDTLPTTSTDKIDYQALRKLD